MSNLIPVVDIVKPQKMFVEAHIADIHFGVLPPYIEYNILKEQFLSYLYQMNVLDIVSINGDLFDHKMMASSEAIMFANQFIYELAEICKIKGATLIIIAGTLSHDSDQLKIFYPYTLSQEIDVRIVTTIQFLYIKGKRILCIPELYNKGEKYYNDYLVYGGLYDACYMHGTYKGAIYGKNTRDLNSNREPVFDIDDFGSCLGPIISGHNHIHSVYDKDFYYCGSPIRWCFGEEQEKGFLILLHDISTRHYLVHFEPIVSFRYDTIELSNIMQSNPNTIINYINEIKKNGIDYLRVMITVNDAEKIAILKSYYRNAKDITIIADYEKNKIEEKLQEMEDSYKNEFSYLFDMNLSPEEKLIQYMNNKYKSVIWDTDSFKSFMEKIQNL